MRLSVIIANWNYRDFVGDAITSALAVDWDDKEVIVVDDASTDDSRSVIESFGGKVAAYFRPKSNHLRAHMFGFDQSTGEVIIFLDADDLLEPEVMEEVATVWRSSVSKVQYRMNSINGDGTQLGTGFPQFPPTNDPERLRRVYLRTMSYTTPPGTGNAYSRDFVRKAFSMAPSTLPSSDTVLVHLAPILGDVLTITKPLARYRVHGGNYGMLGTLRLRDTGRIRQRLQEDVETARLFATAARRRHLPVPVDPLRRCLSHLQYRLSSYLLDPMAHPFPGDTTPKLLCRLVRSAIGYSQLRLRDRTILLAWGIACALAPQVYRWNLVLWRFDPTTRPALIKALLAGAVYGRYARGDSDNRQNGRHPVGTSRKSARLPS
jgi:glycosyltransferase involved in cell wall biosynthesis